MTLKTMLAAALAASLVAAPLAAFAQPAPAPTTTPRPAATPTAPRPATTATTPATTPQTQKVNLNTATAAQLDALPQIGKARAAAILAERNKSKFKDWDDFVARMKGTSVNQAALDAIKDKVVF